MDLSGLTALPTSAGALVVIIVLLVLNGKLVPKSVVDEIRADRDMYKTAYENSQKQNGELVGHVGALLEVGHTVERIIQSLPAAAESTGGSNETVSS